jgi:hypothetical protein
MLLFAIFAFQLVLPARQRWRQLLQDLPPVPALLQKNPCQLQSTSELYHVWITLKMQVKGFLTSKNFEARADSVHVVGCAES